MSGTRLQLKRATAAQWTASNFVLLDGEYGYETDTGRNKIGDGTRGWNSLPYQSAMTGTVLRGTQVALNAYVASLPSGAEYAWMLTDGAGNLLDIISGKAT